MCAICGIQGEEISQELYEMLKTLKHRGMDGSGVLTDGKFSYGSLENIKISEGNFGLGHNLLSIVGTEELQPLISDRFVLVCNGEIYNYQQLQQELNLKIDTDSDCEIIIALVKKFYQGSLFEAVNQSVKYLDGDYAFAIYDGDNLVVTRDPLGVKPVYHGIDRDKNRSAFASERKALRKIGIKDVKTLEPGCMLYNWKIKELDYNLKSITESSSQKFKRNFKNKTSEELKDHLKNTLKTALISAVEKRVRNLSEIGVMFSGGVDSTILAHISRNLGVEPVLYCVGHEDSADFKFAQKTADDMSFPIHLQKVTKEDVRDYLPLVLNAIEEFNIMKLGVGMTAYLAAEMAHQHGQRVILSGQGADELFAGYHRYLDFYQEKGEKAQEDLQEDVENLYHVNLERDDKVTMAHSVELRVPYLDLQIINMALDIPMYYKINGPEDNRRKCILREVARELGVPPEIVNRPKKAAQYGSGIHKILRKKVLKDQVYMDNLKKTFKFIDI